jgi:hypothetical protein
MVLRYSVGSVIVEPSNLLRIEEEDIGVATGLASYILVFFRISRIYRCWERWRPSEDQVASTPKKKCKGPRSLRANNNFRSWISLEIAPVCELVMIISSTYINTNIWIPWAV